MSKTARALLLLGASLCFDAQPADACAPRNVLRMYLLNLAEGVPDANGLIQGQPNANQLRVDEPILLSACGPDLCGYEVTIKLEDESTLDHAVTLEYVRPSEFYRVLPAQPLQPGMYTLTLTAKHPLETLIRTYAFRVEAEPEPTVPDLVPVIGQARGAVSAGSRFACLESRTSQCLGPDVSTQQRPYVVVSAGFEPFSMEQRKAFLVRIMPTANPGPNAEPAWLSVGSSLSLNFREPVPEYCGVVQMLRVRDGAVVSSPLTCFKVDPQQLSHYPAKFETCRMVDRAAYARAWCADNEPTCSKGYPTEDPVALAHLCEEYAAVCGVYVGRRADDEHVCGP